MTSTQARQDVQACDLLAALAEGRRRAKRFIAKWKPLYPSAVACVADNLDALVVHLRFPGEHHRRIRQSNLIERTFGETRRRVKVSGLTMTPKALRRLQDLRREVLGERPEPPGSEMRRDLRRRPM